MSADQRKKTIQLFFELARVALVITFLLAAYAKMKPQAAMPWSIASIRTSLSMFAMGVDSYQLLSPGAVNFVAHWLPPFELFLALWLLTGKFLKLSSLVTTLLLGGFIAVQIRSFSLHQEISCGCFGPGERIGPVSLLRDALFVALAIAVFVGALRSGPKRADTDAVGAATVA
jgi:methylamine utilization protein MauE